MSMIKEQQQAAPYRGLPMEEKNDSSAITSITGETVSFYYSNSGTRTIDAGQAAGVAVEAVLAKNNVKNSQGKTQATILDTSLSFTSTAFTTEKQINYELLESLDNVSWANRLSALTADLANGEYVVDYSKGILYGKKASNQTTLTSTAYKVNSEVMGTFSGSVDVTAVVPGTGATNLGKAEDAAHTSGDVGVMALGVQKATPADISSEGDYTPFQTSGGRVWTSANLPAASVALGAFVTPSAAQTTAYAASLVAKAAAGTLYQIFGYNSHSSAVFIQVHNTTSLPSDTAVPVITFAVPATSNFSLDLGLMGRAFATGITIASSSTGPTLTASGATAWINALYA